MASIISASYALDDTQIDGRHWVTETRHADDGSVIVSYYLAEVGANYAEHLSQMVAVDNINLSESI